MDTVPQHLLIETIFQHIPQHIYIFWKDPRSVYLGCNEQYAQLVGLQRPQDILGKTDEEIGWLPDGDTADKFRRGDQETLAGRPIINEEEWLSLPSGTKILTLVNKVPLSDEQGNVLGVLGVATDITEKKRIEDNLAKIRHQLTGMTIISASISHELRTPLATIKNGIVGVNQILPALISAYQTAETYHLAKQTLSEDQICLVISVLNGLSRKVDQVNHIIDMLITNLTEQSRGQFQGTICSAKSCINYALKHYIFTGKKPKILWDRHGNFNFYGNRTLMVHVLFNLLKNALYFVCKAGKGEIKIWLEAHVDENQIHFKDTALGIKPEDLPRIFEPFFTSGTNKGTGIGLAFCQTILNSYGGSIRCESEYGKYAEFILSFPKLESNP